MFPKSPGDVVPDLLRACLNANATDAHFDPQPDGSVRARLRVDGVLSAFDHPALEESHVIPFLKAYFDLSTDAFTYPAPAPAFRSSENISHRHDNRDYTLRAEVLPCQAGESMTLRIVHRRAPSDLLTTVLSDSARQTITGALRRPSGLTVITGPTGSGKTALLYAMLNELDAEDRKVITVEDPVEFTVPAYTQVQVTRSESNNMARGLRAALRADPDVLIAGELRDNQSASVLCSAAYTGRQCLTTMHAPTCASAIAQLLRMKVTPAHLAQALELVVAVRLLRRADGKGRVLVADALPVDGATQLREIIASGHGTEMEEFMPSGLRQEAQTLVDRGVVEQSEVDRLL